MTAPMPPIHPGEILREEFLTPLGLTAYAVAKACHVPRTRIERVVKEQTPITADTARRLGRFFGTGPELWTNLQSRYDLLMSERETPEEVMETIVRFQMPETASPTP